MLNIRKASLGDNNTIKQVLQEADLHFPGETYNDFWVAENNGKIIGIARLEAIQDGFFLTSLGILEKEQGKGVASKIINTLINSSSKNIYLYTIIPDFFKKFNFIIVSPPPSLPPKEIYGCDECYPEKCVCMVHLHTKDFGVCGKIS